jgi:large subunit ribosomal protein L6
MVFMMKKYKVPEGVEVRIEGKRVEVKGKKGEVSKDFGNPAFNRCLKIEKVGDEITISTEDERRKIKAMVGTIRAVVESMAKGVANGYECGLKIHFVHFPVTVDAKDGPKGVEVAVKNFLGEKKPRKAVLKGVKVKVAGDTITVSGADKEKVGQAAARLEQITKIRGKDRRIFNDGIFMSEVRLSQVEK